jgi:hypothetical protein
MLAMKVATGSFQPNVDIAGIQSVLITQSISLVVGEVAVLVKSE